MPMMEKWRRKYLQNVEKIDTSFSVGAHINSCMYTEIDK